MPDMEEVKEVLPMIGGMPSRGAILGEYRALKSAYLRERPTHTQILLEKKEILENDLARVNAALEALREHPEIETVMNLVQQAL